MTTLCLCDWVETQVERERRLALDAPAAGGAQGTLPSDPEHGFSGTVTGTPDAPPAAD